MTELPIISKGTMSEHVKTVIKYLPAHHDIVREVLVVMLGALVAGLIVRQLPAHYQQYFTLPGSQK